jgi:hypothetical protein
VDGKAWQVASLSRRDIHEMTVESLNLLRDVVSIRAGTRFAQTQVQAAGVLLRWAAWATDRLDALEPPKDKAFLDMFETPEAASKWLTENADRLQRELSGASKRTVAHSGPENSQDETESRREGQAHAEHE